MIIFGIKEIIMTNPRRFRFPKTVLFGITFLYIVIILATYFLYYKEPTLGCAKQLLILQSVAFIIQIALNYFNYHSRNKIVILLTLFVSSMNLLGVLSSFFNFRLLCDLYAG